jgi:hypothetical protein
MLSVVRIGAAVARCAGPALRVNKTPRAIWAASEKVKERAGSRFNGSVHAARREPKGLLASYGPPVCSFQGAICDTGAEQNA